MRRVDLLINQVRKDTGNEDFTEETGIQDETFLQSSNDAQEKIQSAILDCFPALFQKEKEIDAVAQQALYDNPVDLFMDTRVEKLEYSRTGNERDYYELDFGYPQERRRSLSGAPSFYVRQSKQFYVEPKPEGGGKFLMTYQRSLPRLDKRRGRVSTVVLTTDEITSLELDSSTLIESDITYMKEIEYLTVVSKNGVVKMKNIPIDDINSSNGQVTITAGFAFEDGETIAVGDYVVAGAYATSHSQLPDVCEKYLIAFMKWRLQKDDSSYDSQEAKTEIDEMLADIEEAYRQSDRAVKTVPILDTDFLEAD